jgi:hypothetical protein
VYWVIQANMYSEEGFERLLETLQRFGLPYSVHKVIPFGGGIEPEIAVPPGDPVIVMGTISMANLAQQRGWTPGSFLNDNFEFAVQWGHWGNHMLNHDAGLCRFGEVPPQTDPFFLRPVDDSKAFVGQVIDYPSYLGWRDKVAALTPEDQATLTLNTRVVVSTNKTIFRECRVFIVDGKAVTASYYKFGTLKRYDAAVEPELLAWAEARAAEWSPARAYVMDVAVVPYDQDDPEGWTKHVTPYKIVEVNNINSAGWYKADMNRLVQALEDMVP